MISKYSKDKYFLDLYFFMSEYRLGKKEKSYSLHNDILKDKPHLVSSRSFLEEFLSDKEERLIWGFPYLIPVAPDDLHKIGVSGGMWYNVSVPAVADDPPLNDEWHHTTFVNYLEETMNWAGFPGLWDCQRHTWPVEELARGIPSGK